MLDFRDANKDIITMYRGTDQAHQFNSTLVFANYNIVCEVRLSSADFLPAFTPVVSNPTTGVFSIAFTQAQIPTSMRERKIYYRVLATLASGGPTTVINYGEIWLYD